MRVAAPETGATLSQPAPFSVQGIETTSYGIGDLRRPGVSAVALPRHNRHTAADIVGFNQNAAQAKLQLSTCRAGPGQEGVEGHEATGTEGTGCGPPGQRAGRRGAWRWLSPTSGRVAIMAMQSRASSSFVVSNVVYEDGTRSSNRKVSASALAGLDGDAPARGIVEGQDRKIAAASGCPRNNVKSIVRSPVRA